MIYFLNKKKRFFYKIICLLNLLGIELVIYLRVIFLGIVIVISCGEWNGFFIVVSGKCGVIG